MEAGSGGSGPWRPGRAVRSRERGGPGPDGGAGRGRARRRPLAPDPSAASFGASDVPRRGGRFRFFFGKRPRRRPVSRETGRPDGAGARARAGAGRRGVGRVADARSRRRRPRGRSQGAIPPDVAGGEDRGPGRSGGHGPADRLRSVGWAGPAGEDPGRRTGATVGRASLRGPGNEDGAGLRTAPAGGRLLGMRVRVVSSRDGRRGGPPGPGGGRRGAPGGRFGAGERPVRGVVSAPPPRSSEGVSRVGTERRRVSRETAVTPVPRGASRGPRRRCRGAAGGAGLRSPRSSVSRETGRGPGRMPGGPRGRAREDRPTPGTSGAVTRAAA